jgi:hypothetical protein
MKHLRLATLLVHMSLGIVLVVVIVYFWLTGIGDMLGTSDSQDVRGITAGELVAGSAIGQTFTARWPGVCRVEVVVTANQEQAVPGALRLRLYSGVSSPNVPVAEAEVFASRIVGSQFTSFQFEPVPNGVGETLTFYLEPTEARVGQSLTVLGTAQAEAYAAGQAVFVNLPDTGMKDLTFRVHYCPPLDFSIRVWLDRVSAERPGILRRSAIYLALVCGYGVVLSWIGLLFLGRIIREDS